jgi:hypothetical protein
VMEKEIRFSAFQYVDGFFCQINDTTYSEYMSNMHGLKRFANLVILVQQSNYPCVDLRGQLLLWHFFVVRF